MLVLTDVPDAYGIRDHAFRLVDDRTWECLRCPTRCWGPLLPSLEDALQVAQWQGCATWRPA